MPRNQSKFVTDREVDEPVKQDASFRFDADDRQYIDNQIRGLQEWAVDEGAAGADGANLGTGAEVFKNRSAGTLRFRKLKSPRTLAAFFGSALKRLWDSFDGTTGAMADSVGSDDAAAITDLPKAASAATPALATITENTDDITIATTPGLPSTYPVFDEVTNGSNSGLTTSGNIDDLNGSTSWAIFGAFKTAGGLSYGGIIDKALQFYVELSSGVMSVSNYYDGPTSVIPINDDEWHRFIFTQNGGVVRLYVDGVLDGEITGQPALSTASNPVFIGQQISGNTTMNGGIAVVGIATRGVAETEVPELDAIILARTGPDASLGGGNGSINTTNTSVKQGYAEVDTTDATLTQVTFKDASGAADFSTIPLPNNSRVTVLVSATTCRSGGGKSKSFCVSRAFLINGSSTVTANAQLNVQDPEEIGGTSTSTVAIDYTGTAARVDFTGVAANDIRTRFDLQVTTVTGSVFAGAAPTVTSVTQDLADPAGGSTHVIAGSDFTGATALTIGGTNVPTFTVDSDTQITFTAPARAAGASLSVVVTNPTGSNGANTLFEYWTPESLALGFFVDQIKGPYDGTTWAGVASAGGSAGRDVTQASATWRPTNASGEPDFDGVNDFLAGTALISQVASAAAGTVFAIFDLDTQAAPTASYTDPAVFTDSTSYMGMYVNTDGANAYILSGGSRKTVTGAMGTGTRQLVMFRWDSANMKLSIGASIDISSIACGAIDDVTGFVQLGCNYSQAAFVDGRIRTVGAMATAISDADYVKLHKWAQAARLSA